MTLRSDLAALPFLLCESTKDVVLAPPPSPAFLEGLRCLGFTDLPNFSCDTKAFRRGNGRLKKERPYGVPGPHLRRSNVAKYREEVVVCKSIEEIHAAVALRGPKVVIKSEFSSSGQGVRWRYTTILLLLLIPTRALPTHPTSFAIKIISQKGGTTTQNGGRITGCAKMDV
jgi:hypothetical protein